MTRVAIAGAALLALAGCGVVYTAPSVHEGGVFGTALGTDLEVRVVRLTHETAQAANLEPYVPPRLPAAFRADAVASMAELGFEVPDLPPLPSPTARALSRPEVRRGELPPQGAPEPYHIGVGDVLMLALRDVATLEELPGLITAQSRRQGYVVQDDGSIGIPSAGRVRVADLTLQDAEAAIFEALVAAGIDPAFSLEIQEFNSQRVSVGGLVGAPTLVPITVQTLDLDEAIQLAGGLRTEDPSVSVIRLFRKGTIYEIPVERYIDDPAARDLILRDGDSVFVDTEYREAEAQRYFEEQLSLRGEAVRSIDYEIQIEQLREQREARAQQRLVDERNVFKDRLELGAVQRPMAYRAGEVRRPGRFPLPFEGTASLADALFDEQGIDIQTGDYGEIYLLRWPADSEKFGSVTAYHLNAANAVNLAVAAQLELRPNDVVFVSEQAITSWNRVFSQILPQIFLQAGRTFTAN